MFWRLFEERASGGTASARRNSSADAVLNVRSYLEEHLIQRAKHAELVGHRGLELPTTCQGVSRMTVHRSDISPFRKNLLEDREKKPGQPVLRHFVKTVLKCFPVKNGVMLLFCTLSFVLCLVYGTLCSECDLFGMVGVLGRLLFNFIKIYLC